MAGPNLIVPGLSESPLLESLDLGNDLTSLQRAQDCLARLAHDSLSAVVDQAFSRIDAIDAQRGMPLYAGDDEVIRPDADPMLADLACASKIKRTHFRYLLAEGKNYVVHGNLYGIPCNAATYEAGYEGPGSGAQVESEHTHNRHFAVLRAYGASYLAHERRVVDPSDDVIMKADDDLWIQHRAQLRPQDVEYGVGSVYGMYADSTHALELGGVSLSVLVELKPVREFSTSFNADGTIRAHHDTGVRKFNAMVAKLTRLHETEERRDSI
jgi:hypothetical protein